MERRFSSTKGSRSKLNAIICAIALLSLVSAIALSALCSLSIAGTETGEFCPTCPDWTNLDAWLAKKDAYENSQRTGPYAGTAGGSSNANNIKPNINSEKPVKGYPEKSIITPAGASLKGLVILDVRSPEDYKHGHIPGARNIYWESIQSNGTLDPSLAEDALSKAGINNSDKILIYGGTDEGASFMFWALEYLGHKSLSRLDGGANSAWLAGIKPDKTYPSNERSDYKIQLLSGILVNDTTLKALLDQPKIQVLDARDFTDYGKSKLTNKAIQFQADMLFDDDKKMKDVSTLESLLSRRDLNRNNLLLVYGTPAAYDLYYGLRLMGYNATLLEGDWWQETEWAISSIKEQH